MQDWLRTARAVQARAIGWTIAKCPRLESSFIETGRWLAQRSRVLGTLYWFAEDDLLLRLRRSNRRFRQLQVAGISMQVDVTDATGRLHYFHDEPYEPKLSKAIRERLQPGDVFLDIGANIGYFAILAAHLVGPEGRVVAFEPHPEAIEILREAVSINGLGGVVEIVEAAVGNQCGTVPLFLSDDSVLSTTDPARAPSRSHFAFPRSVGVRRLKLDEWLRDRQELVLRIRAIKIDVEGTEADVLEGMTTTLAGRPDVSILCETEAGSAADRLLRAAGYQAMPLDVRSSLFGNYCYERRTPGESVFTPL